jgi:elongation factor P--beta-lysine ligase
MNGDAGVDQNQCDQRMAGVRGEMQEGFIQIHRDMKDLLKSMDDTRKDIAATAAAEAVRVACAKLDETKAHAAERAKDATKASEDKEAIQVAATEERMARTLKDQILDHRIEIGMIIIGIMIAGKGAF